MDVEEKLRAPESYALAHTAVGGLEVAKVWPTSRNYELWLHVFGDPEGPLAREINWLLAAEEPITDAIAEELAQAYLPKARLEAKINDAGDALTFELGAVAETIEAAQDLAGDYSEELEKAGQRLAGRIDAKALKTLVTDLAATTDATRLQSKSLELRLAESSSEVRKLRESLAQARQDAVTDGLSNLANRRAFDGELNRACAAAPAGLCLALIDIDHFKAVNDTWGHQTGDQVIRFVASVIARVGAPPRFAARFGGDEFAMIFAGESPEAVEVALGKVLSEVSGRPLRRRATNELLGDITLSAGFAQRRPGETPAALMERADAALYASKRAGRNRVSRDDQAAGGEAAVQRGWLSFRRPMKARAR